MGRPCKNIAMKVGHHAAAENEARLEEEKKLKGNSDKIKPGKYLSTKQKRIFNTIVKELEAANILGNLDVYVLETTVIAIDRLQEIEKLINEDINKLWDKSLMTSKEKYTKDLWRGCNELSLSPQSRAKLGNLNYLAKESKDDPLAKILKGEDV